MFIRDGHWVSVTQYRRRITIILSGAAVPVLQPGSEFQRTEWSNIQGDDITQNKIASWFFRSYHPAQGRFLRTDKRSSKHKFADDVPVLRVASHASCGVDFTMDQHICKSWTEPWELYAHDSEDKMVVLSSCVHLRRHCAAVIGEIYSLSDFRPRGHLPVVRFTSLALGRPFPRVSVERRNSIYYQSISRRFCTETAKMSSNGHCPTKRSISFQDYDVLGFDLDHTIAKYKLVELFNVSRYQLSRSLHLHWFLRWWWWWSDA